MKGQPFWPTSEYLFVHLVDYTSNEKRISGNAQTKIVHSHMTIDLKII